MATGWMIMVCVAMGISLIPHHNAEQGFMDKNQDLREEYYTSELSWTEVDHGPEGTEAEKQQDLSAEETDPDLKPSEVNTGPSSGSEVNADNTNNSLTAADFQMLCDQSEMLMLRNTCDNEWLSCRHWCGIETIEDVPPSDLGLPMPCYCDAKCQVYHDCCHDFKEHCHNEMDYFMANLSHLTPTTTKCLAGTYTVVDSCIDQPSAPNNVKLSGQENDTYLQTTDYVVTDSMTGIHFTNYSVFSCNRRGKSRGIFWNKAIAISPSGAQTAVPLPVSEKDKRECSRFRMECGCQECHVEGVIKGFSQLCSSMRKYKPHRIKRNETECYSDMFAQCEMNIIKVIKNSDLEFSIMTKLAPSKNAVIVQPMKLSLYPWEEAECDDNLKVHACRVKKCHDSHFRIGQACLQPREVRITLEFDSESETNLFNELKLLELLRNAWDELKRNFTCSKLSDYKVENLFRIIYSISVVNTIRDDHDGLPFTWSVLKELEKFLGDRQNRVTAVPKNARVCVSVKKYQIRQFANSLQADSKSSLDESPDTRDLCDVISFFNSSSASDWSIIPDYNKEDEFDHGDDVDFSTMKSKGGSSAISMLYNRCSGLRVLILFTVAAWVKN